MVGNLRLRDADYLPKLRQSPWNQDLYLGPSLHTPCLPHCIVLCIHLVTIKSETFLIMYKLPTFPEINKVGKVDVARLDSSFRVVEK